jgi:hypothetical protein
MVRQDQDGWEQEYVRQHQDGWGQGYAAAMRGEACRCPEGLDAWSFSSGYIEAVASRQQPGPSPRRALAE